MARRRGGLSSGRAAPTDLFRVRSALQLLEDRRLWHPAPALIRPALSFGPAKRFTVGFSGQRFDAFPSPRIAFGDPKRVAVCVRRRERREVLLASGKGGRNRPGKRKQWSDIDC